MKNAVNEVCLVSRALRSGDDQRREGESDEDYAKYSREYHPSRAGGMVSQWERLKNHEKGKWNASREGEGEATKENGSREIIERQGD